MIFFKPASFILVALSIQSFIDRSDQFISKTSNQKFSHHQGRQQVPWQAIVESARFGKSVYLDYEAHRYDFVSDLQRSGGPLADQRLCLIHLKQMTLRAHGKLPTSSNDTTLNVDVDLYRLLDTYGRLVPGFLSGQPQYVGAYSTCLGLKIDFPDGSWPTRYCWASLRPEGVESNERHLLKVGICLPKSCDSLSYHNKFNLLRNLIEHPNPEIRGESVEVSDLYCLPDEQSPLRQIHRSPQAIVSISLVVSWIAFVLYGTYKHQRSGSETSDIHRFVSIWENAAELFRIAPREQKLAAMDDPTEAFMIVDLNVVDGLKVIYMLHILMGHMELFVENHLINDSETAHRLTGTTFYQASHNTPAFSVDVFFTISGLLTSYLTFKTNLKTPILNRPASFLVAFMRRYSQVVPMYALTIMYLKYLAKFTGSGPFWDYGTSLAGYRMVCKREPWLMTIGLTANTISPLNACLFPAWYVASDLQFYLIAPALMYILSVNAKLGKYVISILCIASCLFGLHSVISRDKKLLKLLRSEIDSLRESHDAYYVYTSPCYRIVPYLVGLLAGYSLFDYEQKQLEYLKTKRKHSNTNVTQPEWSSIMMSYGQPAFLIISIYFVYLNYWVGRFVPTTDGKLAIGLQLAAAKLVLSPATSIFVLVCATGHGYRRLNSFIASPKWKPLARISVCVMLANSEVIGYTFQSMTRLQEPDSCFLLSIYSLTTLKTYCVATVVYILFQAPIRNILNHRLKMASMSKGNPDRMAIKSDKRNID